MNRMIIAAAAVLLVAGCATQNETADVTAVSQPVAVETAGFEPGSQAELEATAGHRVFFDTDQHTLNSQAQATLRKQADWLVANDDVVVQLAGNADERGTREYNLALGARRAEATRAYLVSLGVDADRLNTISYGKERPIAPGSNDQAWALNRNATTMVVSVGS